MRARTKLYPAEQLAVKMAESLTERRQAVGPNVVIVLLATIERLREEAGQ